MSVQFVTTTPLSLTAGTPVAIGSSSILCTTIVLQADSANSGNIYFGGSGVAASNGVAIATGVAIGITYDNAAGYNTLLNLGNIYLNSDATGNKVRVLYTQVNF